MIHLDIIKYILNPLLNWDDCELIPSSNSCIKSAKKKHYSQIEIQHTIGANFTILLSFDNEQYNVDFNPRTRYQCWLKDDKLHRETKDVNTGLTLHTAIWSDESKEWYKDGKCHRTDKDENGLTLPAYINSHGTKIWYKDNKLHRTDLGENGRLLPAYIYSNGDREWWIDGKQQIEEFPKVISSTY